MLLPEAPCNSDMPTVDQSEGLLPVNMGQTQGRLQQRVIQDVSVARPLLCFISSQLTWLQHSWLLPAPDKRPEDRLPGPGAELALVSPPIRLEGITA